MCRRLSIFALMLTIASALWAAPDFKVRSIDDIAVNALEIEKFMHDSNGFIWFSAKNGLYRYDSYNVTNFRLNNANHAFIDKDDNFWCVEGDDAYFFDTKECKYYNVLEKFSKQLGRKFMVKKIRTMADGFTWLLCDDNTCLRVNNKHPQDDIKLIYKRSKPIATIFLDNHNNTWLLSDDATYIYTAGKIYRYNIIIKGNAVAQKRLWLVRDDGRLCYFNNTTRKIYAYTPLINQRIERISGGSSQTYFAVSEGKSYMLGKDGNVVNTFTGNDVDEFFEDSKGKLWRIPNSKFYCEDKYGTIWVATRDGKLLYINKVDGTLKECRGLTANSAELEFAIHNYKQYLIDYQGNLWLITPSKVIVVSFFERQYEEKITDMAVRTMLRDRKKNIWISCRNEAFVRIYNEDMTSYKYLAKDGKTSVSSVYFNDIVCAMCQDHSGNMWLGTKRNGVFRLTERGNGYDITQFTTETTDGGLQSNGVFDLKEDKLGRLWLATDMGLCCVSGIDKAMPRFTDCTKNCTDNATRRRVEGLFISRKGILYGSTTDGLLVADVRIRNLNTLKIMRHTHDSHRENSISANTITGVSENSRGEIFVCTETGGINKILSTDMLKPQLDFTSHNSNNGEPIDACHWAIEYDRKLYVVGASQLMMLYRNKAQSRSINTFMKNENMMFSEAKPLQLSGSKWLFGLHNGCVLMDLNQLSTTQTQTKLKLTSVSIGNNETDYSYMYKDTIVLQPGEKDMKIDFAALDYTGYYNAKYAILNEEKSSNWYFIGKDTHLAFIDLKPGTHQLKLKFTNADGVWMDNEFKLTIIAKPTFWETGWALLLYALIILVVFIVANRHYKYIMNIKQQQKDALKAYMELLGNQETESKAHTSHRKLLLSKVKVEAQNDAIIKRIMEFIDDHISDSDVSIDDMAAAAAVSKSLLHVKIKQIFGLTPGKLINEARMQKACTMLEDDTLSITEVAFACGFSDPKYFSTCFKKSIGETPTDYRLKFVK